MLTPVPSSQCPSLSANWTHADVNQVNHYPRRWLVRLSMSIYQQDLFHCVCVRAWHPSFERMSWPFPYPTEQHDCSFSPSQQYENKSKGREKRRGGGGDEGNMPKVTWWARLSSSRLWVGWAPRANIQRMRVFVFIGGGGLIVYLTSRKRRGDSSVMSFKLKKKKSQWFLMCK